MAKRARKRYSAETRAKVLAAAKSEGLTANDVKKKFGVTPVTYYSWRKKSGAGKKRRRGRAAGDSGLDGVLRQRVQARMRVVLPKIVSSEVDSYLATYFGGGTRRRRKKK
jgi:transposase-like protein